MQAIGPYQIVRRIAVGGMAEVYLAKTTGLAGFERFVALKLIHTNLADNQDFVDMLVDEAHIAVQLGHPNIVQTFDLGCVDERYFLAMEYVEGIDLHNLLRAAKHAGVALPFDACAFIARELLTALDHAHTIRDEKGQLLGIIHRDVAPDNVLVSYTGAVKLADFGIARATSRARRTLAGVIKGKFAYMSPEQVSGMPLDPTTDIHSAGIVLYEMLTGRTLYDDSLELTQLAARIREGIFFPPSLLRMEIPPALEAIVLRALRRDREERYQSAGEMAVELQQFLQMYSPAFVTSTLGSLVQVLLDRVEFERPKKRAETERPHRRPKLRPTRNVIRRRPRESDLERVIAEDPSKEIHIYVDD